MQLNDEVELFEPLPFEVPRVALSTRWIIVKWGDELAEAGAYLRGRGRRRSQYRPRLWKRTVDRLMEEEERARRAAEAAA